MGISLKQKNYLNSVGRIMESYSPLWFSVEFLSDRIGITSSTDYIWLDMQLQYNPSVCSKRGSDGRTVFALRSRYRKETPWYKRVAAVLANRIV
jgi:(2Fe-2S) ferredoxin